jgi:tRNA U38,U39,U40 pseudouridine synthase TruA
MPRYKITVAYDGTLFHGWQRQCAHDAKGIDIEAAPDEPTVDSGKNDADGRQGRRGSSGDELNVVSPRIRTVQDVLERAVREVVREPVDVVGASRTDAGVHAKGQVAAFTTNTQIPVEKLPRAITSRLPDDVQVTQAQIVPDDFDPIRGAIAKGYAYRIAHEGSPIPAG